MLTRADVFVTSSGKSYLPTFRMSEMEADQVPVWQVCSRMLYQGYQDAHVIANGYMDLEGTPDTAENYEMKEVLRAARKETL
ncbi:hypothetical protein TNIN_378761 [Trichonephila inaurata madagascariensis]|uniref:Uncharacterized protein n=1 Tax=Trichonephila inaurata madagascariensis TaxID=2747483 RepID=A0A8X6YTR3_9ARAC|nr:hypothetical protein TNIN_378751 [Trichonephila inaurata madagascariensis]GFY79091.1 hypothetical protein TNIN_378761 [Trichonephila inaurata madagascariensis]